MNNKIDFNGTHTMTLTDFFLIRKDRNIDKKLNTFDDIDEYQIVIYNNKEYVSFLGTITLNGYKVENNGFLIVDKGKVVDYVNEEYINLKKAIIKEKENKTKTK